MPAILEKAKEAMWRMVDDELDLIVKEAAAPVAGIYDVLNNYATRQIGYTCFYSPEYRTAYLWMPRRDKCAMDIGHKLAEVPGIIDVLVTDQAVRPPDYGQEPWIFVKKGALPSLAELSGWKEGPVTKLFGGPSPLAAALASSLLGAGIGYGAGWLGEKLLPDSHFAPGRLRRTGALVGGLLGALPAIWWGSIAHRFSPEGRGWGAWLKSWPFNNRQSYNGPVIGTGELLGGTGELLGGTGELMSGTGEYGLKTAVAAARRLLPDAAPTEYLLKAAQGLEPSMTDLDDLAMVPSIPRDHFNNLVWQDPYTPLPIRSATTGVVNAASMSQGGARVVSPFDIARIGVGMGTGWLSGMLVGKTLGALAGLRPESQKTLQQTGVWAGVLTNVVPKLF